MVSLDSVDDRFAFLVLLCDINADGNVAALDLVVYGLADIMEKSCALCGVDVDAQLRCDETRDMADLDGVLKHVLAVAGAVLHAAEELDDLLIDTVDIGLEHGSLALRLDGGVDFLLSLGDHFLDAGGVDPAVGDELFKCQTRDLAADGIEA